MRRLGTKLLFEPGFAFPSAPEAKRKNKTLGKIHIVLIYKVCTFYSDYRPAKNNAKGFTLIAASPQLLGKMPLCIEKGVYVTLLLSHTPH